MHLLHRALRIVMSSCNTRVGYYSGIILNLIILLHQLSTWYLCINATFSQPVSSPVFQVIFFFCWGGERLGPLGISATSWAIVPAYYIYLTRSLYFQPSGT
jgi:hypothetical protein